MPAGSPDPSIWIQPVASQHQATNLFSNQAASHGRHLVQRRTPTDTPASTAVPSPSARHSL